MNLRNRSVSLSLAALLLAPLAAQAQSINPPTEPQTSPAMTEPEKRNLAFVLDWWREVIDGGHLELTSKYQEAVQKLKQQVELNKKIDGAYKELADKHRKALTIIKEQREAGVGEQTMIVKPQD